MTNEERAIIKDMCAATHKTHDWTHSELTGMRTAVITSNEAIKYDGGKIDWHSFPFVCLEGLIRVAMAGCEKYERFNCLKPFDNGDQRLFSAALRHAVKCQLVPLAIDEETGCRHGYQAAWNLIMRTYHAEQREKQNAPQS